MFIEILFNYDIFYGVFNLYNTFFSSLTIIALIEFVKFYVRIFQKHKNQTNKLNAYLKKAGTYNLHIKYMDTKFN